MASAIRENSNQDRHHETEEDRVMRIQGQFCMVKPTIFKGESNPMAAEEWLRQIKRKMDNQRIPEDIRVVIICTYLEGQAYLWWELILSMSNTEITTWEAFESIFQLSKYADVVDRAHIAEQKPETKTTWDSSSGQINKRTIFNTPQCQSQEKFGPPLCYYCKQVGHVKRFCPQLQRYQGPQSNWARPITSQSSQRLGGQTSQIRPRVLAVGKKSGQFTQGRVYVVGNVTDQTEPKTIEGMFSVFNSWARVLFDCGATHSFISTSFASMLELESENMKPSLLIGSPLGGSLEVDKVCRSCMIEMSGHRIVVDLMVLEMLEYDIILGMDWLTHYQEFNNVFPEDLHGLPPEREVEFAIEIYPGTTPISIPPHRMAPTKLKELKIQLQELQAKEYIHPSTSP
ncbi:unnamed protein product [Prunus brigantina]